MALKAARLAGGAMHTAGIYSDMTVDGPEIGTLVVVVDRAKNLPNRRTMGKQDPYCAARLGKEAKKTETDKRGGQVPKWDQELRFTVRESPDYHKLKVSVFNEDKKTDLIGETWIGLNDVLLPGGGQSDLWHQLEYKGKYAGEIRIELTYYDTRPRVGKTRDPSRSTAATLENNEEPGKVRQGPRAQPNVKRRPLPSHPNSSPTTTSARDASWQTPQVQSGPRHFHTPPNSHSTSSPIEYQQPIDFRRSESQPDYQTPSRPLPNPTQAHETSHSAPLPPTPSSILPDQLRYEPTQPQTLNQYPTRDRDHDMVFPNVPYALQIGQQELPVTSMNPESSLPAIRHERVYKLSGTNPPQMPLALEIHHQTLESPSPHQQSPYDTRQPNYPKRYSFSEIPGRGEEYPPPAPHASGYMERDQRYDPHNQPETHSSAPPPPSHRYSAPPRPREANVQHQAHPQSQWAQSFQPQTSFDPALSRPEEYALHRPEPPAEYSPAGDNPYLWQPARQQFPSPNDIRMGSYAAQTSQEAPVPSYGRRRSEDLIAQQTRSSNGYPQPGYEPFSGSFPGAQKRLSYDPRIHTLGHPISDAPRGHLQAQAPSQYNYPNPPTEVNSARQSFHSPAPLIKPRALSPGRDIPQQHSNSKPVIRKSVSPHSTPPSQGPQAASVPFSPDSYDQFNPSLSRSSPSNSNSNPHTPSPLHQTQPQRELETIDGNILTKDGRVVDPSDHLPVNSWAPEPERKNAMPATVKARLGPREAKPSNPRTRGTQSQENGFVGTTSGGRARLQKRNTSGPLTPAEPNVMNNSSSFSNPYPPPVPAKIPLIKRNSGIEDYEPGGKMTALSREMESIDIGPSKKASEVRFGGIGGRPRRSRFGI